MIDLPATPGPVDLTWRQIDFGGQLTPPLGGEVQRVNRLGNRLAVAVTLPPMRPADAAAWVVALNLALTQGARWLIRQVELDVGVPGMPVVDGAGVAGSVLPIRSATAGYVFRTGQFVTVVAADHRATHLVAAPATVGGDGKTTLTIVPPLRVAPADGDSVLVTAASIATGVTIEGLLEGDGFEWTIDRARRVGLSFTISEQR